MAESHTQRWPPSLQSPLRYQPTEAGVELYTLVQTLVLAPPLQASPGENTMSVAVAAMVSGMCSPPLPPSCSFPRATTSAVLLPRAGLVCKALLQADDLGQLGRFLGLLLADKA